MMIHKNRCLELGLPEPKSFHTQKTYVLLAISNGHTLDTRTAKYIGIANLHSIAPSIRRAGFQFEHEKRFAIDYETGEVPPYKVIHLSMTPEQIAYYKEAKTAKKD